MNPNLRSMDKQRPYRILIGGGGTGGHVFPAIAIADALKEIDASIEFLFVGALGKMEMEKVPEAGYPIRGLPVAGFQRRLSAKNLTFFYKLANSMMESRKIISEFRPDVAVGVGGYASGPILRAAARKRIPILIQEQNSYAGVTNRLLARSASAICVAYEGMERYFPEEKIILTGNPVRKNLLGPGIGSAEALKEFGLVNGRQVCLVVGGSLGAGTINLSMMEGLTSLDRDDIQVLWQCGPNYRSEAEKAVIKSGVEHVRVLPFISRMERAYQVADIIVSRAGAITISELCLVGKPAILVPSPNVAEDHQTQNARALADREAALLVPDREARATLVSTMLELIYNRDKKIKLSENITKLGRAGASGRIAAEVMKLVN
jgi:UDP-N-acetylglucosamine--N-acetylmuramyl-(pentapeptide) pyrophosphoryl-undecaprenol N-acetylglucosamine transferase